MPAYPGAQSKFNYRVESYFGEPLPTNPTFTQLTCDNIEPLIDTALIKVRGCGSRDLIAVKRGIVKPEIKISLPLPADDIMSFIYNVVSNFALTCHILDEGPDELVNILYSGVRIDKATISCAIEDVLRADAELIAQDVTSASTKPAGATYNEVGGAVRWEDITVQKGNADGSNLTEFNVCTDFKFSIANNLKSIGVIRSTTPTKPKYIIPKQRDLTGELNCIFENKDQYYEAASGGFSLKFNLSAGKFVLFKDCQWENVGSVRRPEDIVSLKLAFTAQSISTSED